MGLEDINHHIIRQDKYILPIFSYSCLLSIKLNSGYDSINRENINSYISQLILAIISVLTVGLGGGIYLIANLGAGPRDGLMVGLQKKTNLPIAAVRAFLEITVVSIGWYLGGTVGVGTLLFAFGIGPAVALGLYIVGKFFN